MSHQIPARTDLILTQVDADQAFRILLEQWTEFSHIRLALNFLK